MSEEFFSPSGEHIPPPNTVYIPVSGGLGDVIQVYLSDPATPEEWAGFPNKFPSGDPTHAIWFRRLEDFKKCWPDVAVKLIMASHNARSAELFEYHPCIQEVITRPYTTNVVVDGKYDWLSDDEYWYNIHHMYGGAERYAKYKSSSPVIYMSAEERGIVREIVSRGKFVLMHPFAGLRSRAVLPYYRYNQLAKKLNREGYNVVVVGGSFRRNVDGDNSEVAESFRYSGNGIVSLVDRVSVRVSVALALEASGFIGTHSAMILPAWYAKVRSVCLVPPVHDCGLPFLEFFDSVSRDSKYPDPTTWGAFQSFSKVVVVNGAGDVSDEEIVEWFS